MESQAKTQVIFQAKTDATHFLLNWTPEHYDRTPLIVAATLGHEDMARLLLDRGAKTHLADGDGWTPLHKAACWGHSNVVKLLLNEGAHPNVKGRKEDTPLFLAAKYGRRDVEKILLERGAESDPKYKDEKMRLTRMYREKISISRNSASMIDRRGTKQLCGVMSKYRCQRCDFSSNAKTAMATHVRDFHHGNKCNRREPRQQNRCEKPKEDGKSTKRKRQSSDQAKTKILFRTNANLQSTKLSEYLYSHEYSVFYRVTDNSAK